LVHACDSALSQFSVFNKHRLQSRPDPLIHNMAVTASIADLERQLSVLRQSLVNFWADKMSEDGTFTHVFGDPEASSGM